MHCSAQTKCKKQRPCIHGWRRFRCEWIRWKWHGNGLAWPRGRIQAQPPNEDRPNTQLKSAVNAKTPRSKVAKARDGEGKPGLDDSPAGGGPRSSDLCAFAVLSPNSQHRHISRRFLTQRTQRLAQRNAEADFLCGVCENLCVRLIMGVAVWLRLCRAAPLR